VPVPDSVHIRVSAAVGIEKFHRRNSGADAMWSKLSATLVVKPLAKGNLDHVINAAGDGEGAGYTDTFRG